MMKPEIIRHDIFSQTRRTAGIDAVEGNGPHSFLCNDWLFEEKRVTTAPGSACGGLLAIVERWMLIRICVPERSDGDLGTWRCTDEEIFYKDAWTKF